MNRLRKEINRLLSKRMTNIYLKFIIEKDLRPQNFYFLCLKNLSPGQFLASSYLCRYHWILKLPMHFKNQRSGSKIVCGFYYFNFERNYVVLKSKSPCIFLSKNINFNENETESKMENPTHSFRETNLVLQLI